MRQGEELRGTPSIRPKIYVDLASVVKVRDPLFLLVVETEEEGGLMLLAAGGRIYITGAVVLLPGVPSRRRVRRRSPRLKGNHSLLRRRLQLLFPDGVRRTSSGLGGPLAPAQQASASPSQVV